MIFVIVSFAFSWIVTLALWIALDNNLTFNEFSIRFWIPLFIAQMIMSAIAMVIMDRFMRWYSS